MRRSDHGYAPEPGYLATLLDGMPELHEVADYELIEHHPLLDSASVRPSDWLAIAREIVSHGHDVDGFVVLHGTDTMAYTASALAFMLRGLRKPVVLTGSQIPLCELRTDARENLLTAMLLAAAEEPIPEVVAVLRRPAAARLPRGQGERDRLRRVRLAELPAARACRDRHHRRPAGRRARGPSVEPGAAPAAPRRLGGRAAPVPGPPGRPAPQRAARAPTGARAGGLRRRQRARRRPGAAARDRRRDCSRRRDRRLHAVPARDRRPAPRTRPAPRSCTRESSAAPT